jgi:His-Xaa-Ser system protein HxsD
MDAQFLHKDGTTVVAHVQLDIYGLDPLLKAVHNFTDRCHVHLEHVDNNAVLCRFSVTADNVDTEQIAGEFLNEVLDQTLRARLAANTEPVRRLLLAHAFSKANLLHPELDEAKPQADVIGISRADGFRQ